uniref:Uncharacterized protein n=1 Tax=viral metagenome TaxID=1070528 RepID=A0A6C0KZK8_9ZZZZ|tara:strand:+ start:4530 stop:5471 length:942 start_codon:yes stop_codon:yes gene_type:complete
MSNSTSTSSDSTYDPLLAEASNSVYEGDVPSISGYVFELFQADISLTEDPSFAIATFQSDAFADVSAVATIDVPVADFNNLFFITVDSSDIDDTSANDVIFSIDASYTNPFNANPAAVGSPIQFSNAIVQAGNVNVRYTDQVLKKDVVRHIAKAVTGGYAVADIFSNEAPLLQDVVDRDVEIHTQLSDAMVAIQSNTTPVTVGQISGIADADQKRFYQIAHTLFGITINDEGAGGRQQTLYADLSNASVDASGNPINQTSVTIPLKFVAGDAIALRISYNPKSSPVGGGNANGGGMGDNPISNRSYKILLQLV